MSITVADCLKLPSLKNANIVSGHKGLTKIVTSISVLEYLDSTIMNDHRIFRANEIVLTAFASIKEDVEAQCNAIDIMYESGDVALILFYVGYFISAIDPTILAKSNKLNFPIIVMPIGRTDLGYSEVISEITEAVFNDRHHQSRFENVLLERISQLPNHQRTAQNILQMISNQLKCSLIIINRQNQCVYFVKCSVSKQYDEDEILSLFKGKPCERPYEILQTEKNSPTKFYRIPFTKNMYNHLALIVIDDNALISSDDLLSTIELIETSAEIWKYDIDSNGLEALIPAILNDRIDRIQQIANSFKIELKTAYTALIIQQTEKEPKFNEQYTAYSLLARQAENILNTNGRPPIVSICGNQLVVLLRMLGWPDYNDLMIQLEQSLRNTYGSITILIQKRLSSILHIKELIYNYNENFPSAKSIYPSLEHYSESHLTFAAECMKHIAEENSLRMDLLSTLQKKEGDENPIDIDTLIDTLTVYLLDANCDTRLTSEIMFVHRNTVQFRINKLKSLLGYDLFKMPKVYLLYRAVAINRLTATTFNNTAHKVTMD